MEAETTISGVAANQGSLYRPDMIRRDLILTAQLLNQLTKGRSLRIVYPVSAGRLGEHDVNRGLGLRVPLALRPGAALIPLSVGCNPKMEEAMLTRGGHGSHRHVCPPAA